MLDIPHNCSDVVFGSELRQGSVVRTEFVCADGKARPHYHIIINKDTTTDPLIYVLSTSQLDFYNRNPKFNTEIIRIPEGSLSYFDKETIINCREVFKIPTEKFRNRFRNGSLQFEGEIPAPMLESIKKIISSSRFISPRDKSLILS